MILLDQLNAASGNAITNLAVKAGAKVIDYDRLVVGSKAAYYVSFDNVRVGKLMGTGLVAALKANGKYSKHPVVGRLNGGITDNNAHLFRQGYNSVLNPLYANGTFKKAQGDDQYTDWDPIKGRQIFDQMLARNANHIDAEIAANDGLAGAVIASLKATRPEADPADRPGRDADRRPVHPRRLADRNGLQVGAQGGQRRSGRGHRDHQAQEGPGRERQDQRHEVDPAHSGVGHEEELQAPLHGRLPEEEPGLHRDLQEVLPVGRVHHGRGTSIAPRP